MKYEMRERASNGWSAWRDWLSSGGRVTLAANEFFDGDRTGRLSVKRPGGLKIQLRVKK